MSREVAIGIGIGGAVLGALVTTGIVMAVSGGGSTSTRSTPSTSTLPVQISIAQPSQTTNTKAPGGIKGQAVTNNGVKLTVQTVSTLNAIPRKDGDVPARPGAKIIRIDTLVENVGQKSMDLTCGYPVANKAWDTQQRQFDAVENLYDIPGNPECNDGLQPGFSAKMSYLYEVPQDADIRFLGFADSEVNFGADTVFIDLSQ